MNVAIWQWFLVISSSLILFLLSPYAKTKSAFFKASSRKKKPNIALLTGSLIISWIFAKSITNAANLGLEFGLVGGVAYAGYYVSFIVVGIIIYRLRKKGGFKSIHHFLTSKFGKRATLLFSVLISIRLFNEVWSNTIVIGTYFGNQGSTPYYIAIIVFTTLTLAYAIKGGLSSSIFTDAIQMVLFAVLLTVILWAVFKNDHNFTPTTVIQSGTWRFDTGLNLLFAAILQALSYPFHDPVLTDRGFISKPKTTLKSFMLAGILGGLCIILFSIIGVYAQYKGLSGQAAVEVGKAFGIGILLVINFIMITSAASTLDSTFSSFSKLAAIDLQIKQSVSFGRLAMIIIAVLGTIPVFLDAKILSATTISGTMVIGLTPVFLAWRLQVPRISFYLSVCCGLFFGLILIFDAFPKSLIFTEGKYADLLWVNIWGILSCSFVYFLPKWILKTQQ